MNNIYIGTAGWSYPDWKGVVYPKSEKSTLDFMSTYLSCLEINNTFYRIPEKHMTENWANKVSHLKDFQFTIKLYKGFTHNINDYEKDKVGVFIENTDSLVQAGHKTLLIQLPFFFEYNDKIKSHLDRIASDFGSHYDMILEIRHSSFDDQEVLNYLGSLGYNVAFIDHPVNKTAFTNWETLTNDILYIRLHGRNYSTWFSKDATVASKYDYNYTMDELKKIATRIKKAIEKVKKAFIINNNHWKGQAIANALQMKHIFTNQDVKVPDLLLKAYPFLQNININQEKDDLLF